MPVAIKNSELLRINFAKLRSQLKLIPSLILPSCSFNSLNYTNTVKTLKTTNICSSFAHILQGHHITKHDRSTLTPNVNLNIVNKSSSNLVTMFTSFSSTKGKSLRDVFFHTQLVHFFFQLFSSFKIS